MSFYGKLSSIAIGDLFQNFEANRSTGNFTLKGPDGTLRLHFQDGAIALCAFDGRDKLVDHLVSTGVTTAPELKAARTRRRGTRKSLGEVLVAMGALGEDDLRAAAERALTEDLCDRLAGARGDFEFEPGAPPPRTFDPEERRLELRVRVGPLLLEIARRTDHWELVRKVIPSDSVHFVAPEGVECPDDIEAVEIARPLLGFLDGTRNVQEAAALFPDHRFEAYVALAELVRRRLVRAAESDDLTHLATTTAEEDPARARRVVARGLEAEPRHEGLRRLEAQLAEKAGDQATAAAALKVLSHIEAERGEKQSARELLERARQLAPEDTALCDRLLRLALEEERTDEARVLGLELVELYRKPGLHARALEVLERLTAIGPDCPEIHRELARSRVDAGDPKAAVRDLFRLGRRLVLKERYPDARAIFEEILAIEPGREDVAQCIQDIDSEAYVQRRVRRQRALRRTAAAAFFLAFCAFCFLEVTARVAYVEATSSIGEARLIEDRKYEEALLRYQRVADAHPFSTVTHFDLRRRMETLREKVSED